MASLGRLVQEASLDSKGHQEFLEPKDPKVKWETKAPEGPQQEDRKVSQDLLDFLASQANLATVRMVETGRGDLLALLDSLVYLVLLEQLVLMVTATRQPVTSRREPPIRVWM